MFLYDYISTPIGTVLAGATSEGVCMLHFADSLDLQVYLGRLEQTHQLKAVKGRNYHLMQLAESLKQYFNNESKDFQIQLKFCGTDFQLKIWESLLHIPYGRTFSYSDFASILDMPKAIRAIATAIGQNPVAIVVPCHRVIGIDGKLTGYNGGLWRKHWLLSHEKCLPPRFRQLPFSHEDFSVSTPGFQKAELL